MANAFPLFNEIDGNSKGLKIATKRLALSEEELGPICGSNGGCNDGSSASRDSPFKDQHVQQQQHQQPPSAVIPGKEVVNARSSLSASSIELLKRYGSGLNKLNIEEINKMSNENQRKLSTEQIMKVAGAMFVQYSGLGQHPEFTVLIHPTSRLHLIMSKEEIKNVELAYLLLVVAEKVGYQQYDSASRLLSYCKQVASERANSIQRVVYIFAEALREKVKRATGKFHVVDNSRHGIAQGLSINMNSLILHQKIPMFQVLELVSIQTITENIGSARKIHWIDFNIRAGVHCIAMMQALAEREVPIEHLRISAISFSRLQDYITVTGKKLESFASTMNIPFTFSEITAQCVTQINADMFKLTANECVIVVCSYILRAFISRQDYIENLMGLIRSLNPTIMLVSEVEANHNSPTFVNRFIEALFYYSTYFDCLETCMNNDIQNRTIAEEVYGYGIQDMITSEGDERITRNVKIDVWRAFFSRYGMKEIGISELSMYQANLALKQSPIGQAFTIEKNGKCLLVGWKGTPLHSLSAWRFTGGDANGLIRSKKLKKKLYFRFVA